jgi:hypothetical protein
MPSSFASAEPAQQASLITLTRVGPVFSGSPEDFDFLRARFKKQQWLLLPKFFDERLLNLLLAKLEETDYRIVDRETGVELRPVDCTAYLAAELLLNTPNLFRAIRRVTGCGPIASFSGRVYRRPPSDGYFNRWHNDVTDEGRMIALSINLTPEPYEGGALQIRSAATRELVCEVPNPKFGDALIFPVDERFEHRVCKVEGTVAKTALAGWFRSNPDPNSLFGRGRHLGATSL